jgi:maleate cis-trans isomerase
VQRFLGLTFLGGPLLDIFARYFSEAGFDVAGMEALPPRSAEWANPSTEDLYLHIKRACRRYNDVQGIYLLGSGGWRVKDLPPLEEDLGIPVVHPVAARVWYVQKRLQIRQPIAGAGRLLETMP